MSEPITKRLKNNFSSKKYSIKSQMTYNLKSKQKKISKNEKSKTKYKEVFKKDTIKIKVKRKPNNKILNSRNDIKTSEIDKSFLPSYNNIMDNDDIVFLIKNNNNENTDDKFNKEEHMNNEKYTKDSDFIPKTFYINNYNNNYINISNITIENNEKSRNQEKENDKTKYEELKKSFSDKNLISKKSLKEEIIISDDQIMNKDKDLTEDKSTELYSKEKGSNLSCLLSYSKDSNCGFDSFYFKTKKHMYKNNHCSLNNIESRKKEKSKKKQINISLNYRDRNEVYNIYSNKNFYHNNKTFFKESKSVKNFLLDLRRNKFTKEKEEKLNNSVTFRKAKKIKSKEKESILIADNIKKIFKIKKVNMINKNNTIHQNMSLKNSCTIKDKCKKHRRDLSHSITKKNYSNNINEQIMKNRNNNIKISKNNIIEHKEKEKDKEKKNEKMNKNKDKLNPINKLVKEKRKSINNNKHNKNITKSKCSLIKQNKYKEKKINTKSISSPLSISNSNNSKKEKVKEYPNMVKKPKKNLSLENYQKKIKSIGVICKVGDSGTLQKKLNQDNYFITHNFLGKSDYKFLGVCDGHGIFGQNVSSYLKEHLPMNVQEELIDQNILDLSKIDITKFSEIIESIYKSTNLKMNSDERIDSSLSGSTCISGLFTPSHFYCINVGDSRCVLFKYFKSNNYWSSSNLSRDHKPNDINEKSRILQNGGIVESYINSEGKHVGPERVWVKSDGDRLEAPGLAMSRSFGDQIAHSVGVVVSPEILEHPFNEEDKIILLASDGIWEFFQNEEVLDIVKKYYDENNADDALEELYQEADRRWRENEGIVDDITAIILFLE